MAAGRLFAQPAERRTAPSKTKAARGVRRRCPMQNGPMQMAAPDAALFGLGLNFGFEVGRDSRQGFGHAAQRLGGPTASGWANLAFGYLAKPFQFTIKFTPYIFKFFHRFLSPHVLAALLWHTSRFGNRS